MAELKFKDVLRKKFTVYTVSSSGSISEYKDVTLGKRKIQHMCNPTFKNGKYVLSDKVDHVTEEYYFKWGPLMSFDVKNTNISAIGLNKNGNIQGCWGYAVFLNKEKARELARKIVTTKYQNSIKRIESMWGKSETP